MKAKDLGNYHPTLKKLFEPSEAVHGKKRERGLKMGVGKFRGGFLKLGKQDVAMAEDWGRGLGRGRDTTRPRGPGGDRTRGKPRQY